MEGHGRYTLLGRTRDDADRRIVHVQRTVKGAVFLSEFADQIAEAAGGIGPRIGISADLNLQ